jgi:hypothetical protein
MEADWEIEIGENAPVMVASWEGFIDLLQNPDQIGQITEIEFFAPLRQFLMSLNSDASPVWTAKCDLWAPEEFDPYEFEADPESTHKAFACYVDLFSRGKLDWIAPNHIVRWCASFCTKLHDLPLKSSRIDLIVRRAVFGPGQTGFGITAYLCALGSDEPQAKEALGKTMVAFEGALLHDVDFVGQSQLQ